MSFVDRYFSTVSAGTGDGTTWANRAQLINTGAWSTVISGFDFTTQGLRCLIGPGTYTPTATLQSSVFTVLAPTVANSLFLHGCDASGVALAPPAPAWTSDQPAWDDSTLPVITTTTNIPTVNLSNCFARLLKFTSSARTISVVGSLPMDWCSVINSTSSTTAAAITTAFSVVSNSVLACTGTSYAQVAAYSNTDVLRNVRVVGNSSATSGTRYGVAYSGTSALAGIIGTTIVNNPGGGWIYTGATASVNVRFLRCMIVNNGGDGIVFPNTASQTARQFVDGCYISGNGGTGINPGGTNTNVVVTNSRLRDNTTANFGLLGSYPADLGNYTTDSDDTTEFVNASGGDFRIKNTAAIWGKGYGVSDQPTTSGGWNSGGSFGSYAA